MVRSAAPLRQASAEIARRVVALRAWERLGYARARDYAAERAGISGRQLQELARTGAALRDLPDVRAAFVAGALTWTQARLIARVASHDDAATWIRRARQLTAEALAREVRALAARAVELDGVARDEDGNEEIARETVFVTCTPEVKQKWHRARFLASRHEGRPVPNWVIAERLAAEALSATPLDAPALRGLADAEALEGFAHDAEASAARRPADGCAHRAHSVEGDRKDDGGEGCVCEARERAVLSPPDGVEEETRNASGAHAPRPRCVSVLLEGLDEADAFELDTRLRRALALEQRLHARLGPLLLVVARGRLYRRSGCASVGAFAREWLGMSPRKAEALLRLERTCRSAPALRTAYRAGDLSWVRAQGLAPLLRHAGAAAHEAGWVAHAESVTVRRLDDDVALALASGELEPPDASAAQVSHLEPPPPREQLEPQVGARGSSEECVHVVFSGPREVARLFRATLASVQRRIERRHGRLAGQGDALDAMLEHAFTVWTIPPEDLPREHRVFARDGFRCTVPGCTSYSSLHDHHIVFRSAGGSEDLSNRTTLCAWHHLRGVHAGVVRCRGMAPGGLRFDLGLRRGRPPLVRYGSGDRLIRDP